MLKLLGSAWSLAKGLLGGSAGKWIVVVLVAGLIATAAVFYGLWQHGKVVTVAQAATIQNQQAAIADLIASQERAFHVIDAKDVQITANEAACAKRVQGMQRDCQVFMNVKEVPAQPGMVVDDETSAYLLRELDALLPR